MAHSKAYYQVRSIVRSVVGAVLVAAVFIGVHVVASNIVSAVLVSGALFVVYFLMGRYQGKKVNR